MDFLPVIQLISEIEKVVSLHKLQKFSVVMNNYILEILLNNNNENLKCTDKTQKLPEYFWHTVYELKCHINTDKK